MRALEGEIGPEGRSSSHVRHGQARSDSDECKRALEWNSQFTVSYNAIQ